MSISTNSNKSLILVTTILSTVLILSDPIFAQSSDLTSNQKKEQIASVAKEICDHKNNRSFEGYEIERHDRTMLLSHVTDQTLSESELNQTYVDNFIFGPNLSLDRLGKNLKLTNEPKIYTMNLSYDKNNFIKDRSIGLFLFTKDAREVSDINDITKSFCDPHFINKKIDRIWINNTKNLTSVEGNDNNEKVAMIITKKSQGKRLLLKVHLPSSIVTCSTELGSSEFKLLQKNTLKNYPDEKCLAFQKIVKFRTHIGKFLSKIIQSVEKNPKNNEVMINEKNASFALSGEAANSYLNYVDKMLNTTGQEKN